MGAPNPILLACNPCFSVGESPSIPPVYSCAASIPELVFSPWILVEVVSFAARLLHVCGFCTAVVVSCALQIHPPVSDSHCSVGIWKSCSFVLRDSYPGETKPFPAKTAHGNKGPVGEHKLGQHMWKIWLVQCHLVILCWTRASWCLALYKHSRDLALQF